MSKDYYAILGVSRSASDADIKSAYRKLSRELHPDKHKGDKEKEKRFKEVNEAYEVIGDPKKRKQYDQFGAAGMGGGFRGGFSGFQGFDPSQFEGMEGFGDIFEAFFGGGGRRRKSDGRGAAVEVAMTIEFQESVTGVTKTIRISTPSTCETCDGKGSEKGSSMKNCAGCGGTGVVTRAARSLFGIIQQSVQCEKCGGSGKIPEHPCKTCRGEGRVERSRTVTVNVPAGISDGQSLRLRGEGEAGRQGAAAGDLLVHIQVKNDPTFERDGDDIRSVLTISISDAALGADLTIDTVHGKTTVRIPAGTQPGHVLRIKGKGMPVLNSSRRGDHYVSINIHVPEKLTREQKRLFEDMKRADL